MFDFIKKSPFGLVFTAAAIILAVSPEAREATRKLAVKSTAAFLDLVDQARNAANTSPALLPMGESGSMSQSDVNSEMYTEPSPEQ